MASLPAAQARARRVPPTTATAVRTTAAGSGSRAGSPRTCGTTRRGTSVAARGSGSPAMPARSTVLPLALTYRAGVHVHAGEFAAASALHRGGGRDHAARPAARPACTRRSCSPPGAAGRPRRSSCIEAARQDATRQRRGTGARPGRVRDARCSTTASAATRTRSPPPSRACEHDDLGLLAWALIELVEAAARSGEPEARRRRRCGGSPSGPRAGRHRLGARDRGARHGALLSDGAAAEAALPGGDRAARADPHRRATSPARTSSTANGCGASAAALDAREQLRRRPRAVRRDGRRGVRRARRARAARHGRDGAQADRRDPRRAHRTGGADRAARRATGTPTPRSARSCSSARGPSSTTCTRCSRSSGSARAPSSTACDKRRVSAARRSGSSIPVRCPKLRARSASEEEPMDLELSVPVGDGVARSASRGPRPSRCG